MSLLRLAWKNLVNRPLALLLSLILFALGVGLISFLFQLEKQMQDNFEKNLAGVDLVVGAKGSPLQLILSSMYHIDAPTGNINLEDIRPFLNPKHPLIAERLPLAMGDSYKGYRIVGTTQDILAWYAVDIAQGDVWTSNFEITAGAAVAKNLNLKIGSRFKSSHGFVDDEGLEHEDAQDFVVTSILKPSGTVVDQLLLTTPQSFWLVHDHDDHQEEAGDEAPVEVHDHDGHSHEEDHAHDGHDHNHKDDIPLPLLEEDGHKQITSLLLQFKGHNYQALNMQRSINENTEMQAATPAIEINRLRAMMDSGERALRMLAFVIILVSGLSIFISLYTSLQSRRYELSLMRVMGAARSNLFVLILMEGLLMAVLGYLLGILLAHGGMQFIGNMLAADYRYDFNGGVFLQKELWLLIGALVIGILASVIPAWQASKTDISETLMRG